MKALFIPILFVAMLLSATSFTLAQSTASSDSKMPMHDNMSMESTMNHANMKSMGQLMTRMGNALGKHEMSAEQQKECAMFMNKLTKLMTDCAADVELKDVKKNKVQIEEITKEWNYFEEGNFEDH